MKSHINFSIGNRCSGWYSFSLVFILLALLFTSCTSKPEPYSVLEFTGKTEVYNYSKYLFPIIYESDSANPAVLLASNGDIIVYGENNCLYYRKSLQNKFSVKTVNNAGFINEKINSITIPCNDAMIPWFEEMKSADFSMLGFLNFDTIIPESYIPYLNDIAKTRPDNGMGYGGDLVDIGRIFKIFSPQFIVGTNLSQKDFNILSGLTNLEILSASLHDSVYTAPLPAMPKLKQLILTDVKKNALNNDFLINNKQIEKLTVMQSRKFNFLILEPLKSLKELIINEADTIEKIDLISNHKQLELLSVISEKFPNDMSLKELPGIRWMTFYDNATQDGFSSFIESHPDLEVVELINNDTIKSLQPLLNLKKIEGLIVTDKLTDLATVKSLKTLKYLSLPEDILNDTITKAELQKSLPGTRIVPNHGICLGSGWLMLIIPFILFFRVFIRQKPGKVHD
ncbi:MAG: hypothetical protein NTZ85_07850 [Bacteroidia bacterium]|jgi:hypothetical protein|nr:hypothetical protein [Bacteroidia bacterium]